MNVPVQRQKQRGSMFRNSVRRIVRHADDRQTGLEGCLEVNVIVARAPQRQHLDPLRNKPLYDRTVDLRIHERTCRVTALRKGQRRRCQPCLEIPDVVTSVVEPVKGFPVVGFRVEKSDSLHIFLLII